MLSKIRLTIERYQMIKEGDTVMIALSGGPDSVCLLFLLSELRKLMDVSVCAGHINHGLRGEESLRDQRFCEQICQQYSVPLRTHSISDDEYKAYPFTSLQGAARELRYKYLRRLADKLNANKIATGHTASDQVETVLFRILRGTGMGGLGGIRPVLNDIIRPLIDRSREEVLEYLKTMGVPYIIDSSNLKPKYLRNQIRLELIPVLKRSFNPSISNAIINLADLIREENEYLESLVDKEYEFGINEKTDFSIGFNLFLLKTLHKALARRIIIRLYNDLVNYEPGLHLSNEQVEWILQLAREGEPGNQIDLPGNIRVHLQYDRILFTHEEYPHGREFEVHLSIPGEVDIPQAAMNVKASLIEPQQFKQMLPNATRNEAFFDVRDIKNTLTIRSRKPGDRIALPGMEGTKKLQDIFVDDKIPRLERDSIPIVLSGNEIIWIIGNRQSRNALVKADTHKIVHIKGTYI